MCLTDFGCGRVAALDALLTAGRASASPAPRPASGAVAPSARGAPGGEPLAGQVRQWAAERCVRTTEHSASLDGLLSDYRQWAGGATVGAREFERALATLGGVRVLGHAVVVGIVLQ